MTHGHLAANKNKSNKMQMTRKQLESLIKEEILREVSFSQKKALIQMIASALINRSIIRGSTDWFYINKRLQSLGHTDRRTILRAARTKALEMMEEEFGKITATLLGR